MYKIFFAISLYPSFNINSVLPCVVIISFILSYVALSVVKTFPSTSAILTFPSTIKNFSYFWFAYITPTALKIKIIIIGIQTAISTDNFSVLPNAAEKSLKK